MGDWGLRCSASRLFPGFVNFVTALAYLFCLALPAAFTQLRDHLLGAGFRQIRTEVERLPFAVISSCNFVIRSCESLDGGGAYHKLYHVSRSPGFQSKLFASLLSQFGSVIFLPFHFHTGRPILITPHTCPKSEQLCPSLKPCAECS